MILLVLILVVVLLVVVGLLIYARWEHGTLEKMGIPVVPHHPLLGSTRKIYTTVGGLQDYKWMKKYGKIFGVYEGRQAQLYICDPELVRLICVKDAEYFNDRRRLNSGDPVMNELPGFQPPEKWKLLRSLATPAFTSAKIKMMNLPMIEATNEFVLNLKRKIRSSGKGVLEKYPIDNAIHTMLTDLISRCVFSIRITGNQDEDNEFARIVHELISPPTQNQSPELLYWSHTFPFLKKIMPYGHYNPEPAQRFVKFFKQMINERRRSKQTLNDVVDMCMEWYDKLDTPEFKKAKMTEMTIFCQALVFFFASQDQVSTMIAAVIYHMTKDSKIEKKVYEEIDSVFGKHNGKVDHENLYELVYLNACLSEALRLYPFLHRAERVCTKDWINHEYGLNIKKGMTIQFPIWAINRCSEYNPNGENFDPERFMPENKDKLNPYASTSFGFGMKACTAIRFANEVMPLVAAYVLKSFKFLGRDDTNLEFIPGGPTITPHKPIYVDIVERAVK